MSKLIKIVAVTSLLSTAVFADVAGCLGCHGNTFEKKAMNVSKVVKDMTKEEIVTAMKGYKDGTYGGAMKAIMKGQASNYADDAALESLADEILATK
jgi:cytochrome c-type protein NapB